MSKAAKKQDKVKITRDEKGKYNWSFTSRNGALLAQGIRGYSRRIDAVNACARVTNVEIDFQEGDRIKKNGSLTLSVAAAS